MRRSAAGADSLYADNSLRKTFGANPVDTSEKWSFCFEQSRTCPSVLHQQRATPATRPRQADDIWVTRPSTLGGPTLPSSTRPHRKAQRSNRAKQWRYMGSTDIRPLTCLINTGLLGCTPHASGARPLTPCSSRKPAQALSELKPNAKTQPPSLGPKLHRYFEAEACPSRTKVGPMLPRPGRVRPAFTSCPPQCLMPDAWPSRGPFRPNLGRRGSTHRGAVRSRKCGVVQDCTWQRCGKSCR